MKKRNILKLLALFLVLQLASSCVSRKEMIYFQNDEIVNNELLKNYAPTIQADDIINILVSAEDFESAKPFNLFLGGGETGSISPITYLVDLNGNISFPVIGELKASGLTTNGLKKALTLKLESYIKNPIVTVRLENFRITVLGEVKSPGTFNVANERISIPEAIGLAGDLSIQGKRKNLLLIRNNNGNFERIRLDLTDASVFNSPYYYLAQNDILYVEPNKAKVNSSAIGTTSSLISIATALLSIVLILTR